MQHVRTARRRNLIEDERARDQRPDPAFVPVCPMPGFVRVEHALVRQNVLEFLIRPRDRGTGLFPCLLRTAHADRNLQRGVQQPLHHQAWQPAHDRQIRDQRRELRAELADDLVRQGRLRRVPACSTPQPMAAIFRDVWLDRGQLRHLVTARVADLIVAVQTMMAVTTRVRHEIDDGIHAPDGDQRPRVSRMARLSAQVASTLRAATPFAWTAGETIGGRWLRRCRRVLLSECELTLQVRDAFGLFGDLPFSLGELLTQSLNLTLQALLGIGALLSLRPRHASHGTPIGSICTAP